MRRFEEDIEKLKTETGNMGMLALSMLEMSLKALREDDGDLAREVITDFNKITQYDIAIEADAIRILSLYQPTAADTRVVSTVLKSITYLERIGKYSKNIAIAALSLDGNMSSGRLEEIDHMSDGAVEMVRLVVTGFIKSSIEGFDNLRKMDDSLDEYRKNAIRDAVCYMKDHPDVIDLYTYYLSITRYLERVGDHACKIGEKVTFMVTGKHIEIDS
jgi:phosphate transport system protein